MTTTAVPVEPSLQSRSKRAKQQILGIDIIRFVAALMVMNFHYGFWVMVGGAQDGGFDAGYHWLAPYTWFGWIGVEVFFVISGFVIAYSAHSVNALKFAKNRFIRLYPAAFFCGSVTLAGVLIAKSIAPHHALLLWAKSISIFPLGPWIDGSYWTLPIELSFYTLIFLLLAVRKFHRLEVVMILLGIYSTCVNVIDWLIARGAIFQGYGPMPWKAHGARGELSLCYHGVYFAIGALLWLSVYEKRTIVRTIAMIVFSIGGLFEIVNTASNYNQYGIHLAILPIAFWLVFLVAIVFSVVKSDAISQFASPGVARICRTLGLMTYPLYLVHQRLGFLLIKLGSSVVPSFVAMLIVEAIMVVVSYFIVVSLEQPTHRVLKRVIPG